MTEPDDLAKLRALFAIAGSWEELNRLTELARSTKADYGSQPPQVLGVIVGQEQPWHPGSSWLTATFPYRAVTRLDPGSNPRDAQKNPNHSSRDPRRRGRPLGSPYDEVDDRLIFSANARYHAKRRLHPKTILREVVKEEWEKTPASERPRSLGPSIDTIVARLFTKLHPRITIHRGAIWRSGMDHLPLAEAIGKVRKIPR
jgi:hypothetical protein